MPTKSGYGIHQTVFGNYTNEELICLYRETSWFNMSEVNRQQLLQETVNRYAKAKGEIGACEVRFEDLDSTTLGRQSGNAIEINRSIFANDTYIHEYNGHIIEQRALDSNFRALETILHEDMHAWQNQCIDGIIQCSDQSRLAEYKSNNFTVSLVQDRNGNQQLGSHYLSGLTEITGYYMYYFQSTERDAHYYSEKQTMMVMHRIQEKYGIDKSILEYQNNVLFNGYHTLYQKGQGVFGNTNFDKEINQVLANQYYGTSVIVDPNIQVAVKKEMVDSYRAQNLQSKEKEESKMDNNYTPVTMEDYDNTMRSSVNAFYEHAMNDSSMSKEEAIAETGQMAENYLSAMEELQMAHENGEITSVNDSANTEGVEGTESSINNNSGINDDGGVDDDGGIE